MLGWKTLKVFCPNFCFKITKNYTIIVKKLLLNRARCVISIMYLNLVQNNLVFTQNKFLIFSVILFNETIII